MSLTSFPVCFRCYKRIRTKSKGREPERRYLFHGTSDARTATAICHQNFDPRLHGKNGTYYGLGAYFARDASYSNNFAVEDEYGLCHMFLASVIVGQYTVGKPELRRPPSLSEGSLDLYDSCVDKMVDPAIYVVFEREQAYPAYKIVYRQV